MCISSLLTSVFGARRYDSPCTSVYGYHGQTNGSTCTGTEYGQVGYIRVTYILVVWLHIYGLTYKICIF